MTEAIRAPRALILLRPDVATDRQLSVTSARLEEAGYELVSLLQPSTDLAEVEALVRTGQVEVVVVAFEVAGDDLDERVDRAGGRVEAIHRSHRRATVRAMIATLHMEEGWSADRIASRFGIDSREVADHLRRSGVRRPR